MSSSPLAPPHNPPALTNGSGAAAILSAAVGSFTLAILAIAADKLPSVKAALVFYKPTGPLSGVTTLAILLWFLIWAVLELRWRKRTVALGLTSIIAFALLALSFLLTFPPIADLF
jgi:hypothetical protein